MSFPVTGIVPREETQSNSFMSKNPLYDGRGIIIGVLDTGIDPGAAGLQVTTEGKPKLIDIIDCSGSGDVDMSKKVIFPSPVDADADSSSPPSSTLVGLTGRNILLPTTVTNPTNEYRLGIKAAFELWPENLVSRVKKERAKATKTFQSAQELAAQQKLEQFHLTHKPKEGKYESEIQEQLTNINDEIEMLKLAYKDYNDVGPIYDCVVYHDGSCWQALVDTSETGDLTNCTPITDYHVNRQFKCSDPQSMMNYSVNIFDEGSILSINVDAGAHGSHVAGICAGYHPDREDLNGVAPGAQVISLKIGDSRLGSMESGPALTRAMIEAKRLGCDVINMSYGEACCVANQGRFIDLAKELVEKYNIIFVASAGNNGPALSTVGCPGGTTNALISVGAFVSPNMMVTEYSMRELSNPEGCNYTWSSVGPAEDGGNGVDLVAPGGAICSIPNWCLSKNQLMNGTSMSGPNCAGCVALLCSGLKQKNISYTATRVKSALYNSAKNLDSLSCMVQGYGLVQVSDCFDFLCNESEHASADVRFDVTVNRRLKPSGIYLRSAEEVGQKQTFSVSVKPNLRESDDVSFEAQTERVEFEIRVNLSVKAGNTKIGAAQHNTVANCDFVSCPDHCLLMSAGRGFTIEVDPTALGAGVHFARLFGHDSQNAERGFIFDLPICIIIPCTRVPQNRIDFGQMNFAPSEYKRFFLNVPMGATFMDVTLKDERQPGGEDNTERLLCLHTIQLLPHTPYRDAEKKCFTNVKAGQTVVTSIAVQGGVVAELCIGRYWSTIGLTELSFDVEFRGVEIVRCGGGVLETQGSNKILLSSRIRNETVEPKGTLDKWQTPVRPASFKIVPCGSRDTLSSGKKVYRLELTYSFKQEEEGDVTIIAKGLQGFLYESVFEHQFFFLYNKNKKRLGLGDCWPEKVKCEKGDISCLFCVMHEDLGMLEKMQSMVVYVERDLKSAISLGMYMTHGDCMGGGKKFGKYNLALGSSCAVFVGVDSVLKGLPKGVESGDKLLGKLSIEDKGSSFSGDGLKPGGYEIVLVAPPAEKKAEVKKKPLVKEAKDERTNWEKMEEETKVARLDKLDKLIGVDKESLEKFGGVFEKLKEEYGEEELKLLCIQLKMLDGRKREDRGDRLGEIVDLCDKIVGMIDQGVLAAWFGVKHDTTDGEEVKEDKEMKERRGMVIDCLGRKIVAVMEQKGERGEENFEAALKELKKWDKVAGNDKMAVVELKILEKKGLWGSMLQLVKRLGNGESTKGGVQELGEGELLKIGGECFGRLRWENLVVNAGSVKIMAEPAAFALF